MDDVDYGRKSFGHTYALGQKTDDKTKLAPMLMKLCEKTGRRMRAGGYCSKGIHLSLIYDDHTMWHKGRRTNSYLYTTQDIFRHAMLIFNMQPSKKIVTNIFVTVYDLMSNEFMPRSMFDIGKLDKVSRSKAIDNINDTYGEFSVVPANMLEVKDIILDRIAFGGSREIEDLYK